MIPNAYFRIDCVIDLVSKTIADVGWNEDLASKVI